MREILERKGNIHRRGMQSVRILKRVHVEAVILWLTKGCEAKKKKRKRGRSKS